MRQYRYRTPALTGPWRDSRDAAVRDAVKAKQATIDEVDSAELSWIVPGRIEEESTQGKPPRAKN